MTETLTHFIGGKQISAPGTLESTNPSNTAEVIAKFPDGSVEDVCIGTGIADDISFYYNRPKVLNDFHVSGAVLLAGTEMMKMSRQK